MRGPGLPLARKFPCKRNFWRLQGNVQGNEIYKEMVRKFYFKQGIRKEIVKIIKKQVLFLSKVLQTRNFHLVYFIKYL
jgi:hypothetical protein